MRFEQLGGGVYYRLVCAGRLVLGKQELVYKRVGKDAK